MCGADVVARKKKENRNVSMGFQASHIRVLLNLRPASDNVHTVAACQVDVACPYFLFLRISLDMDT